MSNIRHTHRLMLIEDGEATELLAGTKTETSALLAECIGFCCQNNDKVIINSVWPMVSVVFLDTNAILSYYIEKVQD